MGGGGVNPPYIPIPYGGRGGVNTRHGTIYIYIFWALIWETMAFSNHGNQLKPYRYNQFITKNNIIRLFITMAVQRETFRHIHIYHNVLFSMKQVLGPSVNGEETHQVLTRTGRSACMEAVLIVVPVVSHVIFVSAYFRQTIRHLELVNAGNSGNTSWKGNNCTNIAHLAG